MLLAQIGRRFAAAGMAPEAVAAFTKGGDIKAAIDSCVEQNCWGAAVALAEESGNVEIGKRLGEYAAELIDGGRQLHAVDGEFFSFIEPNDVVTIRLPKADTICSFIDN